MNNPMNRKKTNTKSIVITSAFWIIAAGLVVGFIAYGNARYNSGVNAGFDRAQSLLEAK